MNHKTSYSQILTTMMPILVMGFLFCLPFAKADDILWLDKPATNWEKEAMPLGNGRLGCMVFGGVPEERIQFNVDSLWTGDENLAGDYRAPGMGFYQNFGNLYVTLDGQGAMSRYRRELNLSQGLCRVTYAQDGVEFVLCQQVGNFFRPPAGRDFVELAAQQQAPRREDVLVVIDNQDVAGFCHGTRG